MAVVCLGCRPWVESSKRPVDLESLWRDYKVLFLDPDGSVRRPNENDVVSEGVAYAMLRAVWMEDHQTFEAVFRWSDAHLSRKNKFGDHLLAWRWAGGEVKDWMAAADADVDYALSLIMASRRWKLQWPQAAAEYEQKARWVIQDVMNFQTIVYNGQRHLTPWILTQEDMSGGLPLNPSYFSPAHYRIFYQISGDPRWLEMVDSAYSVLKTLTEKFDGRPGKGIFPDWCLLERDGTLKPLTGKSAAAGWESLRVAFRIGLDDLWFSEPRAQDVLRPWVTFLHREWKANGRIACEYGAEGKRVSDYENAAFYAMYALAARVTGSDLEEHLADRSRKFLKARHGRLFFHDEKDYYTNSLVWLYGAIEQNRMTYLGPTEFSQE